MRNTDESKPTGYLRVSVTSGGLAYPVEGAIVLIRDGNVQTGSTGVIYSLRTDRSGQTPSVPLEAKDGALSESPGNASPFTLYSVEVMKEGYARSFINEVQVFEGISATLPVNLVPLGIGMAPYSGNGGAT